VTTNSSGIATAPAFTANATAGSYTVTASVSGIATPASYSLTNTAPLPTGALNGWSTNSATPVSLTAEGNADWIHWGDTALNRKSGGTPQLTNYTLVGAGSASVYNSDPRAVSWNNGTPLAGNASDFNGVFIAGTGNGFSVAAPADTTNRTLLVHIGGRDSGGRLTAHLSDGSAVDYTATTSTVSGLYDMNYTLTYAAGSAGQTLTVTWVMTTGTGGVSLNAAALSPGTGSLTANAGTPQSAVEGSAFAGALKAVVSDASGNPVSGVTVTFTAPSTGAGGTFSGAATATATADVNGIATAPQFTANSVAGTYSVTASATGVAVSTAFSLTNTAGAPAGIVATVGTPQSATVGNAFATALQATVSDSAGNPVSGVTVTFSAPSGGASGTFAGSATATAVTDGNGNATAPAFAANSVAGSYTITAGVSGVASTANFTLTNLAGAASSVTATAGTPQSATEGTTFATLLKATVRDASGNAVGGVSVTFSAPGSGAGGSFGGSSTAPVTTNTSGIATAPAFTANTIAGSYTVTASAAGVATPASFSLANTPGAAAGITASAGTPQSATEGTAFATALQATVKDAGGNAVAGVTVTFTAPGSGASGTFSGSATATATTNSGGIATAPAFTAGAAAGAYTVAATVGGVATPANFSLTNTAGPASGITAAAGTPQSTVIGNTFATALQATVKDSGGNPVSGVTVTFTAPASGASGKFGSSATATATTSAGGVATAPAFTANTTTGSYTVTATVAGVATPANFSLTNNAAAPGSLAGSVTTVTTTVNLTSEGSVDWIHWGDSSLNRKSGVTAQLSTYSVVGTGSVSTYSDDPRAQSWSDGTPTRKGTNITTGVFISGVGHGFSVTAPADTTVRTLVVHVGGWASSGKLTAHLSDGSAVDFTDTSAVSSGQYDRNYTLTYNAASSGQTLTVTWVMAGSYGNVTLSSASLH
jgi:hypothetical protein